MVPLLTTMGYVPTGDVDVASQVNCGIPPKVPPSEVYVNSGKTSPYIISKLLAVNVNGSSNSAILLKSFQTSAVSYAALLP
jgi:hypothetical protein